jgi:hypothetical protein
MDKKHEVLYWDCNPYQDDITHGSIKEAVTFFVENYKGKTPETITVYGFAYVEPPDLAKRIVNFIYGEIDDHCGNPMVCNNFVITEEMLAIAKVLQSLVAVTVERWQVDEVCKIRVRTDTCEEIES